jgi:outer membrane protein OmpA-like peptidoglycan-associated protein
MQFCGFDKWEAINYWDLGTDGANNSPRYQVIREIIKDFEPYPDLIIKDELGNRICPPMPEHIDSSELYVDVEHLVYVPESIPEGFSVVMHNVSFAPGRTTFPSPENNVDIQNLILALNQQPELKVELGGYTDNTGSYAQNVDLSRRRAKFIYDFLLQSGIAPERISYKGYGPKKPLYSNRYKSTREGNRRIEILVVEKNKEDFTKLIEEDATGQQQSSINEFTLDSLFLQGNDLEVGTSVIISSLVYEPNMVAVPEEGKKDLNTIANWLKANKTIQIEIAGHTDRSGLEELNQLLSEQRAEAVYNYLLDQGIPAAQIRHAGYGSQQPIASNKYQYGKEMNRRIEVVISDSLD